MASRDALKGRRQAFRLLPNPFDRALGGSSVACRHAQPPGRKSFGCDVEIVGHGKLRVSLTNRPDDHAVLARRALHIDANKAPPRLAVRVGIKDNFSPQCGGHDPIRGLAAGDDHQHDRPRLR